MKLSKNFLLEELVFSITANNHGINNTPNAEAKAALKRLAVEVLQPIRDAWGQPIVVTSGYRCPKLNACVGGVKNSQHVLGQAADIKAANPADNGKLFACIKRLIESGKIKAGQCIWEYGSRTCPKWVHVSLPRAGKKNNQFLYYYS
jgi:hypothetical protein